MAIRILLALFSLTFFQHSSLAQCNNLLVNGNASGGITAWTFSTGTGAVWSTESNTYGPAFVSSYNWGTMVQVIDLLGNGFAQQFLNTQPPISYSQMYKGHATNYADFYYYKIELRNASNQVMATYNYGTQSSPITVTQNWDTVSGTFTNYGTGLRYVRVECAGDDAEYWAGNYGAIIDNSVVSLPTILNVNICSGSYSFNSQTISTSGTYTATMTGSSGCDSTVILNLHIGDYDIEDTIHMCTGDTFVFDGQDYTDSASLSGSFTSMGGCDSNVSYEVYFHDLFDDTITVGVCPGTPYAFGTQTIYIPGTYTGSFTTPHGCDSSVVLVLSFNPTHFFAITDYMCEGDTYDFGGIPLATTGSYSNHFTNASGCDSLVNLTLLMDYAHDTVYAVTLCGGDTFALGTQSITSTGVYSENIPTVRGGCDSLVTVDVNVTDLNLGITVNSTHLLSNEQSVGTTWQWLKCGSTTFVIPGAVGSTYSPTGGGSYAVVVTREGCTDTSACHAFVPAGVEDVKEGNFTLFPVPASDRITLTCPEGEVVSALRVMDMHGRVVQQSTNNQWSNVITLNTELLSSGSYMLSIEGTDRAVYMPFTVE